ncbi:MAG: Uncharacterized protein XD91_0536 [Clostridiales bacterium 38_11]|nr:MAG: Uncharacterized protein XD91_0536 [Clostridiales bacterium 38_11]HBH13384.1 DUF445 domain-containing protein [Clostridiales bacterium]
MATILIKILILAVIGSAIGYITNVLAIKMLFRPYNEIKIPILNVKLQGVIPKRQEDIAVSIGETVETELINLDDIIEQFATEERIESLLKTIKVDFKKIISNKIMEYPLLIGFKNIIISYIDKAIENEGKEKIREMIVSLGEKAQEDIKISKIVEERINSFDLSKLEALAYEIAKKELRYIEVLGGVLGFMIGIVQGIIVHLF